ncbi:MAG: hypothetical protein JWO22_2230 [Frankiales bacterium]|nr:hypothetical protein [Frankiales bacterium]
MTPATAERPGDGPALVLMHGLGDSRKAFDRLLPLLPGWRVVTVDLRGHGESATAPWSWPAAVDDLREVVEQYDLEQPFVGGHSLGGMVALQYALAGHPVAGVINIDGWGPGVADRFLGEDPVAVQARIDGFIHGELPALARLLTRRSRQYREGTVRQVLQLLDGADPVAWHRDAAVPSLAVHALDQSRLRLLGKEMTRMQEAHHRGLTRDLTALPGHVTLVEVHATHGLCRTRPQTVAAAILDWAGRA